MTSTNGNVSAGMPQVLATLTVADMATTDTAAPRIAQAQSSGPGATNVASARPTRKPLKP